MKSAVKSATKIRKLQKTTARFEFSCPYRFVRCVINGTNNIILDVLIVLFTIYTKLFSADGMLIFMNTLVAYGP